MWRLKGCCLVSRNCSRRKTKSRVLRFDCGGERKKKKKVVFFRRGCWKWKEAVFLRYLLFVALLIIMIIRSPESVFVRWRGGNF
jgi:hypothetical protein